MRPNILGGSAPESSNIECILTTRCLAQADAAAVQQLTTMQHAHTLCWSCAAGLIFAAQVPPGSGSVCPARPAPAPKAAMPAPTAVPTPAPSAPNAAVSLCIVSSSCRSSMCIVRNTETADTLHLAPSSCGTKGRTADSQTQHPLMHVLLSWMLGIAGSCQPMDCTTLHRTGAMQSIGVVDVSNARLPLDLLATHPVHVLHQCRPKSASSERLLAAVNHAGRGARPSRRHIHLHRAWHIRRRLRPPRHLPHCNCAGCDVNIALNHPYQAVHALDTSICLGSFDCPARQLMSGVGSSRAICASSGTA